MDKYTTPHTHRDPGRHGSREFLAREFAAERWRAVTQRSAELNSSDYADHGGPTIVTRCLLRRRVRMRPKPDAVYNGDKRTGRLLYRA
jgi:hypothetical protein